jgi:glycosyltransferase involved in cell wall biosynthesis
VNNSDNKKILFFLKLPPRITGANIMNSYVNGSKILRDNFKIKTLRVNYSSKFSDIGDVSFKKFLYLFKIFLKLIKELLCFRPNLIYFQISPLGAAFIRDLLFVVIIKIFNVKMVYHLHGKGIKEKAQSKLWKLFYKFVFKNEAVICLSSYVVDDIRGVYDQTPYIVPNAIPVEVDTLKQKSNKSFTILFFSNLFISKGILVFLNCLSELNKRNIDFVVNIVGDEADVDSVRLHKMITEYKLDGFVNYLGPKYDQEKWDQYLLSDVLIFPTLNDIWGLVILEAMQAGLPVIASIDGAVPEMVEDGVTGYLVEKGNVNQIVEKIEYLFNNREKLEEMGELGREKYLKYFTLNRFESNMKAVFDDVIQEAAGS